ncbi:MAG: MFS transporter [Planctomycetota bacterium]
MLRIIWREYEAAFSGLPATAWWLSGVLLVNRAGTMVLPFLTLYITQDLELSKTTAGLLLGAYGVGSAAGALLGGRLSDRFGPRPVMLVSLALSAVGFWVLSELKTAPSLAWGLFALGVVAEAFRPANGSAIATTCPPEKHGRAFALQRLALNAGMTIGPACGGFLAKISYDWLFIVNGAAAVASLLFLSICVPNLAPSRQRESAEAGAPAGRSPWADGTFLFVMLAVFLSCYPFFQLVLTSPVYYKEFYLLDEVDIGLLFAVNTAIIVLFEMVLIHRVRAFSKLRVAAIGCLFFAVGTAMIPLATGFVYAVCTIAVWTIGEMLISPLVMAWVVERAPEGATGRYLGVFSMAFSVGQVVVPYAGLALYQNVHADAVWYVGAAICVVITPVFWWAARQR